MNACITTTRASHRPRRAAGWLAFLAFAAVLLGPLRPLPAQNATRPASAPADTRVARLVEMVMYVPTPQLEARFGSDPRPLGDYINALKSRVAAILATADPVPAQGLFVAVGLKSNRRSKVWCQAVEGTIPVALLKTLERELGEVKPVTLKTGPAGFGLKFALGDKPPAAFPSAPERWTEAAKSTPSKTIIPPDEVFRILWPD